MTDSNEQQPASKTILITYPLIGLAIGAGLFVVSVIFAGGGHGSYGLLLITFPFAMLAAYLSDVLIVLLGLLQFPLYGFLIARDKIRPGRVHPMALIILAHILAVLLVFINLG